MPSRKDRRTVTSGSGGMHEPTGAWPAGRRLPRTRRLPVVDSSVAAANFRGDSTSFLPTVRRILYSSFSG